MCIKQIQMSNSSSNTWIAWNKYHKQNPSIHRGLWDVLLNDVYAENSLNTHDTEISFHFHILSIPFLAPAEFLVLQLWCRSHSWPHEKLIFLFSIIILIFALISITNRKNLVVKSIETLLNDKQNKIYLRDVFYL